MTNHLEAQCEYDVKARRISGTRAEKLDQIEVAIQELLDIKTLECLADRPNVHFIATPRPRSHAAGITVTILALLIVLVLLLGVRSAHATPAGRQRHLQACSLQVQEFSRQSVEAWGEVVK